jgi:phosphatidate cytidylyltransferase
LLAQRVGAAVVAIPILIALIWIGGWPYTIAAALILGVAAAEFSHLKAPWLSVPTLLAGSYAALLAVSAFTVGLTPMLLLTGGLAVSALPALYLWLRRGSTFAERVVWLVIGVSYVGLLGSTIVLLRDIDRQTVVTFLTDGTVTVTTEEGGGRDWVFLTLFATFAVDTSAYFTGRAIGRHKLAPAISPKKTWEGFFGGYVGGFAAVLALKATLDVQAGTGATLLIAATLPLAAAAGDLIESWVKRRTGVKDASELIPGHGGMLDRLDSLLLTFPLVYFVAERMA